MSYLALYRTFRPKNFQEVVRQEHIVTILKNQIQTNRIGHAYLFCGPRGTGKTTVAKIFARAVNCQTPVNGSPCGKCAVCKALEDEANLDIVEIDAASNNGVEEMRDLREKVQYPPVAGKYKVYIVDEVHMLSQGAFNALLKTLEEPPKHAVFILATTEVQKIPATILSRCMRFDFKLLPQEDLEKQLRFVLDSVQKPYEEEAVSAIARAGAGSARDMLSIADACISYQKGTLTYADVNTVLGTADFDGACNLCADLLRANGNGAYEKTEAFLAAGKSVSMLIKDVLSCLNACALVKTCRNANAMLGYPAERFERVKQAVQEVDGHRILRVTQIFAEIETSLRYSSTPRVLFEAAVLEASMPEEDYETEALVARIADLEKEVKLLKEGGRVAVSVPQSVPVASEKPIVAVEKEPKKEDIKKTETVVEDEYIGQTPPPDEEETGGFVYFDTPPQTAPKTAAVSKRPPQATSDAKATYGSFLRAIRRASKNAVLVTMCMDLDCHYEGGLFVCETTSDTAYRSLKKSEHYAVLQAAFAEIGIAENGFEVRLRAKDGDAFNSAVAEIRKSFSGVNVKLK